jgi:thiamine pyrophosphate-dependent acetolactate synthase large subunit-like protein
MPNLNGVMSEYLRKVRGEQDDVFAYHKCDLTMNDLEKLIEACKQKGIRV